MWAREPKDSDGNRPGLKESRRWTEGYERVAERAEELPGVRLVYVADRESDLFEWMKNGCRVEALQLSTRARLELALGIYRVVAWRVAYMQRMGRTNPHLPARVVFSAGSGTKKATGGGTVHTGGGSQV